MNRQVIHDGRNSYLRLPAKAEAGMSYKMKVLNYNQPEQLLRERLRQEQLPPVQQMLRVWVRQTGHKRRAQIP